jgi:hypothetical protein
VGDIGDEFRRGETDDAQRPAGKGRHGRRRAAVELLGLYVQTCLFEQILLESDVNRDLADSASAAGS